MGELSKEEFHRELAAVQQRLCAELSNEIRSVRQSEEASKDEFRRELESVQEHLSVELSNEVRSVRQSEEALKDEIRRELKSVQKHMAAELSSEVRAAHKAEESAVAALDQQLWLTDQRLGQRIDDLTHAQLVAAHVRAADVRAAVLAPVAAGTLSAREALSGRPKIAGATVVSDEASEERTEVFSSPVQGTLGDLPYKEVTVPGEAKDPTDEKAEIESRLRKTRRRQRSAPNLQTASSDRGEHSEHHPNIDSGADGDSTGHVSANTGTNQELFSRLQRQLRAQVSREESLSDAEASQSQRSTSGTMWRSASAGTLRGESASTKRRSLAAKDGHARRVQDDGWSSPLTARAPKVCKSCGGHTGADGSDPTCACGLSTEFRNFSSVLSCGSRVRDETKSRMSSRSGKAHTGSLFVPQSATELTMGARERNLSVSAFPSGLTGMVRGHDGSSTSGAHTAALHDLTA